MLVNVILGPFGDPNPHPCYHGGQDRFTQGNVSAKHIPNQHRVTRGTMSGWAGTHKGKGEHYPYRRQRFFSWLSSNAAPEKRSAEWEHVTCPEPPTLHQGLPNPKL